MSRRRDLLAARRDRLRLRSGELRSRLCASATVIRERLAILDRFVGALRSPRTRRALVGAHYVLGGLRRPRFLLRVAALTAVWPLLRSLVRSSSRHVHRP